MSQKIFAERLNQELDAIDFPTKQDERIEAFSKLIKLPKFKAELLLNGNAHPEPDLLQHIADELEVNPDWLTGASGARK